MVVNTAEDVFLSGNLICPDIDTVLYTCSDQIDRNTWFGRDDDSLNTHDQLKNWSDNSSAETAPVPVDLNHPLSADRAFVDPHEFMTIGDRDRALHIRRTAYLQAGATLCEATQKLSRDLTIQPHVLPMTNDPVSTYLETAHGGTMHFQEFWLYEHGEPEVNNILFRHTDEATAPELVLAALEQPVIIGPSNPITSIGPMLALDGVLEKLKNTSVIAISPFLGDDVFSGPAARFLDALNLPPGVKGLEAMYEPFLDHVIIDESDDYEPDCPHTTAPTAMDTADQREQLVELTVDVVGNIA